MAKEGLLGTLDKFNHNPFSVFGGGGDYGQLQGDWQPHNTTVLGSLADAYLKSRGQDPIFAPHIEEQNMQEAMDGFADNPLDSIKRLSKIHGHEGDAWKMYEQYTDDKRMQDNLDRQNQLFDLQKQKYVYGMVANMMQAGAKDDETWNKMKDFATNYGNQLGVDVSYLIPDKRDPDSIAFIQAGAVPVAKQEQLDETNRHNTTREGQMKQGIDERVRHDQTTEGQGATRINQANARLSETHRHNSVTEKQGQDRLDAKKPGRVIQTPQGQMELDPTGTRGRIGTQLWAKVGPGQWKRIR